MLQGTLHALMCTVVIFSLANAFEMRVNILVTFVTDYKILPVAP